MGLSCPYVQCEGSGSNRTRSIIRYGFHKTKWGKRRPYQCQICGKIFCSNTGTHLISDAEKLIRELVIRKFPKVIRTGNEKRRIFSILERAHSPEADTELSIV